MSSVLTPLKGVSKHDRHLHNDTKAALQYGLMDLATGETTVEMKYQLAMQV